MAIVDVDDSSLENGRVTGENTKVSWRTPGGVRVWSIGLGDERVSTHRPWHDVRPSLRTRTRIVPQHRTDQREDGHLLVSKCHWTQGRLPAQGSSESVCPNAVPCNYFNTVAEPLESEFPLLS